MTGPLKSLMPFGCFIVTTIATTFLAWPWVQGAANTALATFAGTTVWAVMGNESGKRILNWAVALAKGVVAGAAAGLTLRWLTG